MSQQNCWDHVASSLTDWLHQKEDIAAGLCCSGPWRMRLTKHQWLQSTSERLVGAGGGSRTVYYGGYRAASVGTIRHSRPAQPLLQNTELPPQNEWVVLPEAQFSALSQRGDLPGQHPFTLFPVKKKKYSDFSSPCLLSDYIAGGTDSALCCRIAHQGNYILLSQVTGWRMGPIT